MEWDNWPDDHAPSIVSKKQEKSMTDNDTMINKIAESVVEAFIERLAGDAKFIKAIAESPWMKEAITNVSTGEGLSEMVGEQLEKAIEGLEIGTENIHDFDNAVGSIVDDKTEHMEIEADSVSGLDDFIDDKIRDMISEEGVDEKISNALGEFEVEADNVSGLDDLVEEKIGDIDKAVAEYIDNNSDTIIDIIKNSPDVAEAIANQLKVTT